MLGAKLPPIAGERPPYLPPQGFMELKDRRRARASSREGIWGRSAAEGFSKVSLNTEGVLSFTGGRRNFRSKGRTGFVPMPLIYVEYGRNHEFEVRKRGEIQTGCTHFYNNDVVLAKITPAYFLLTHISI